MTTTSDDDRIREKDPWAIGSNAKNEVVVLTPEQATEYAIQRDADEESEEDDDLSDLDAVEALFGAGGEK